MTRRGNLPDGAAYDPTPAEAEAAERAKPLKVALCLRCKAAPRVDALPPDARGRLSAASTALTTALHVQAGNLPRATTERAFLAHLHLTRAGKGWLCVRCVASSLDFALDIISGLEHLDTSKT